MNIHRQPSIPQLGTPAPKLGKKTEYRSGPGQVASKATRTSSNLYSMDSSIQHSARYKDHATPAQPNQLIIPFLLKQLPQTI
ncbi:hypothetical protein DSO57_1004420 [Entomophthora muscae]|uniref:Uncharacterized protein n=1 Tax=Entomophthora muscae TaxID=34485 RepID=A0ACC2TIX0_9FUNG|nr:hypothetical protein DSO57_1004420 [Entomophthora muscae]